ncbi:glycine betaine ABC transporter substrate-binding protein [Allomesorhizobium camelthorni]|uniref:glycine betaine ABC transporter substrate-binding protein n=1 Tax=Allomesorhizobium camelthorni TaxID=475069 RepID=UPI003CCDA487
MPRGTPEFYSDPAYVPNPDVTGDCDFLPTRVFKTVWPGFEDKWPAAYEVLKGFTLSTDAQQRLMGTVDVDGRAIDAVTSEWVNGTSPFGGRSWMQQSSKATEHVSAQFLSSRFL